MENTNEDRIEVTHPPNVLFPAENKEEDYIYYEVYGNQVDDISMEEITEEEIPHIPIEKERDLEDKVPSKDEDYDEAKDVHADTYKQGEILRGN